MATVTSTRAAVLDAALACFAEHGFSATTIEQIRARSGASIGSIYHHFGGKEGIAAALYVDGLADYQDGVRAVLARHPSAEDGVRGLVRHHLRWVSRNRALASFLMNRRETEVVQASEERVRALNRETFALVREWYGGALPFDLLYAIVLGPAQEFARHWLAGTTTTSITRAERLLGDAAWAALKGDDR